MLPGRVLLLALFFPLLTVSTAVLKDSRDGVPQGFVSLGEADSSKPLKIMLALASSNTSGLEAAVIDVSTPSSANYGKHLNQDQVNAFLAPKSESLAAVNNWLSSNNISAISAAPAGDWIALNIPVSKANALLSAKYETFNHTASGTQYTRTLTYSLPADVADHIDHVHPSTIFDSPQSGRSLFSAPPSSRSYSPGIKRGGAAASPCVTFVSSHAFTVQVNPACLQSIYSIPTTFATSPNNTIAVTGLNHQSAQTGDMKTFLSKFRPDIIKQSPSTTFALTVIDDGITTQFPSAFLDTHSPTEANLDTQYTVGLATGVPVEFFSIGSDGGFITLANHLLSLNGTLPTVLTTSYGSGESQYESGSGRALAIKLCTAYMALGARGVSVLYASGDSGVGTGSKGCSSLEPTFPSGCPYITSVGGTSVNVQSNDTSKATEEAATLSSGGFSNIFPAPEYQKTAVSTYLNQIGSLNNQLFNRSGRAYPDVSAAAESLPILQNGKELNGTGGTSAASPIFASVIALLNDERLATGKPPLGFLNPLLYSNPTAFNDIVEGSNPAEGCTKNGFPALKGWDPVTGLGSPNFAAMKAALVD